MEVDETLVDAHLEGVPGLGTLTVGGLTGGDLQVLGGEADGALDAELLGLGTVDELLADLLEGLDVARGEGDADLVDLGAFAEVLLALVYRILEMQRAAFIHAHTVRHDIGWWECVGCTVVRFDVQSRPGSVISVM